MHDPHPLWTVTGPASAPRIRRRTGILTALVLASTTAAFPWAVQAAPASTVKPAPVPAAAPAAPAAAPKMRVLSPSAAKALAPRMLAPNSAADIIQGGAIALDINKAQVLQLAQAATAVFIANPDIADVQAYDPQRVLVFGKKAGSTTIFAFMPGGKMMGYAVTVAGDVADVTAAVRAQAPGASLDVSRQPNGLTVSGRVRSPHEAEAVKSAAQQFLGEKDKLIFNVAVAGSTQVNLQVRVAEVSRQVTKSFGFNWDVLSNDGKVAVGLMTGRPPVAGFGNFIRDPSTSQLSSIGLGYQHGSFSASALIDALQAEGFASVLAEPNLTASSGETASFLAGGEFPVPVSQGLNQISIEWKRFGVSLDFTPTVLDGNRLSIRVKPEVSELSSNGAVVINNIQIPSIAVRRAETTVELGSGESFAIAGMFQNNSANSIQRYPWLGDIPVLGTLFRSNAYKRNETELVIIVTPYVVEPVANPNDLHAPTDGLALSSGLEQTLLGRLTPKGADNPHLAGPAGFLLEDKH